MSRAESLPRSESLPESQDESLPCSVRQESRDDDGPTGGVVDARWDWELLPDEGDEDMGAESLPENECESLPGECCSESCKSHVEDQRAAQLHQWKQMKAELANDEVNEFVYQLLVRMKVADGTTSGSHQRFKFHFLGLNVCRVAFRELLGIGNSRLNRLMGWMKQGHMQPPRDLRHSTVHERGVAATACDTMLQWAYDVLAERLNSSDVRPASSIVDYLTPDLAKQVDDEDSQPSFCALPNLDGYHEWIHGPGATVPATAADAGEVRWLPPMALVDLYNLMLSHDFGLQSHPSYISFTRVYNERWHSCLRIRPKILQSKCDTCERLKVLRKSATSPEAAEAVRAEHLAHVKETFMDRAVDERIQSAAREASTTPGGVARSRSIFNLDIDAMEAMKFKCPRNISAAKTMAALWRPQQHMVGSIVDGIADYYWLVPPDIVKNANLSATIVADLLHHAAGVLDSRQVPLPTHLRVHSDNAGGEVKNQTFMKFLAFLSHKEHFDCTEMTQFRPGHSHGRIDQNFSVIGTALNKSTALETPSDFQARMEATGGGGKRSLRVTQLGALYDWKSFFDPLHVAPHNHVQTHAMNLQNTEACHVFRFFRRDRMRSLPGELSTVTTEPNSVFLEPPADDDIIFVSKHYVSSQMYAQPPEVFCPGSRMRALDPGGPDAISGRVQFSQRQVKEFRKTAATLAQHPWNMHQANEWLTNLIEDNQNGYAESWTPPTIARVVTTAAQKDIVPRHPPREATAAPVPVRMEDATVAKAKAKAKTRIPRKRPASAPYDQRDRNMARPSVAQGFSGAPVEQVSEAGAPPNVMAPPAAAPAPLPPNVMPQPAPAQAPRVIGERRRANLLAIPTEPRLGCSKCREALGGCTECRKKRDDWRFVHQQS